ncbi:hypothetical protein [Amycolatopsis sp. NPDC059021]|uniref:hypothetical protein n=1 Tax=Amycolatopsis sp. NPDC059021 TaxID=3346704 RepID=UPI00366DD90E
MHFLMAQDLVNEREAELRRGTRRPRGGGRACLGGTRRQRLGWTLVEVGLRLAVEPYSRTESVGARDFRV